MEFTASHHKPVIHLVRTALKHSRNSVEMHQNLEASPQATFTEKTYFFFDPLPIKILPVNLETRYPLTPRRLAKIYAGLYFTEYFFKTNKQKIMAILKGFLYKWQINNMEGSLKDIYHCKIYSAHCLSFYQKSRSTYMLVLY